MDVSSSTESSGIGQADLIKKATDIQEKQIQKIIESATEQSKQVTAQKTGIGNNINITG
jgi:hypothetical protein